jgi:hypothetical protein
VCGGAPCSVHRHGRNIDAAAQPSPAEERMILDWGHTFCQRAPTTAPSTLPSLPLTGVPVLVP